MPISVTCPECGAKLKAPDKLAGKKAKCKCGNVVAVPAAGPSPVDDDSGEVPARGAASAPRWRPMMATVCANCQAKMQPGSVICLECGFHTEKGIVIPLSAAAKAKGAAGAAPTRGRQKGLSEEPSAPLPRPAWMKLASAGVILAVAGGIAYVVMGGGGKASLAALDSVSRGMSVDEVVRKAGRPTEVFAYQNQSTGGLLGGLTRPIQLEYTDHFLQSTAKDRLRDGFWFVYRFGTEQRQVHFDGAGAVIATGAAPPAARP